MKRIACLWLPDWPIQRLRASRSELQEKLILLHVRHPQRGLCVKQCCSGARARGIREGIPLTEAQSLLRRALKPATATSRAAPRLTAPPPVIEWHCEPHDPSADLQALRDLAWLCERFSPLVGMEEGEEPASLLVDATHLGPRHTPEPIWLAELQGEFSQRGFLVHPGLADTIGIAWAIAHFSPQEKLSAIAPAGLKLSRLRNFPLPALRMEAGVLDLLGQLGVTTIGDFLKLPRDGLATRFGVDTLRRLDQAAGKEPEVFQAYRPAPPWREKQVLEYPTSDRDLLEHVLRELLKMLGHALRQSDSGVMELACRLEGAAKPATALRVALFRPTVDAEHLFKLVHLQLENLTFPEPIETISIEAMRTARLEEHQGHFWDTGYSVADSPRLRGMIERLSSRLGVDRVSRIHLRHDAQPEYAFTCEPLTRPLLSPDSPRTPTRSRPSLSKSARKKSAAGEEALWSKDQVAKTPWRVLERPLLLLSPPKVIEVTALAPEGPPARFRWQGKWRRIARHWGPERIDVGWHRGPSVRRDYFRVETDEGERLWLFQDRLNGQWKLHGFFS